MRSELPVLCIAGLSAGSFAAFLFFNPDYLDLDLDLSTTDKPKLVPIVNPVSVESVTDARTYLDNREKDLRATALAETWGLDHACFDVLMGEVDRLQSQHDRLLEEYRKVKASLSPKDDAAWMEALNSLNAAINQKLDAAERLIPNGRWHAPKAMCQ